MKKILFLFVIQVFLVSLSVSYNVSDSSCTCSGVLCCCPGDYLEGDECVPCVCYNGGSSCDQLTGECLCEADTGGKWSGDQCTDCVDESECRDDCKHCTNGDRTGACFPSLAGVPGFSNTPCDCVSHWTGVYCDECPDEIWGDACDKQCNCQNGAPAACHQATGVCDCVEPWAGDICTECVDGYWGSNCDQLCDCQNGAPTVCNQTTGVCECVNAWTGDKCTECPDGWTGQNCDSCDTGYASDQCQPCECNPPNCYYGDNCESLTECTCYNGAVTCNHVTGVCECPPPWSGDDCTVCNSSLELGGQCNLFCSHCYNALECLTNNSKECECTPGYYGHNCTLVYEKGDDIFNCYNGAPGLFDEFGDCICAAGWTGQILYIEGVIHMCTTCDPIEENKYCNDTCRNCYNSEACDPASSNCHCVPGWKGSFCDEPCDEGGYGDLCKSTCSCEPYEVCDHVYGCVCPAGFNDSDCTSPCDDTHYGLKCQFECRCRSSEVCDSQDGSCHCPLGKYGVDCSETCDCPPGAECDPLDGTCHCKDNAKCITTIMPSTSIDEESTSRAIYPGSLCTCPTSDDKIAVIAGSAAVCGSVFTIIIGLLILFTVKKIRSHDYEKTKKVSDKNRSNTSRPPPIPPTKHVYVEKEKGETGYASLSPVEEPTYTQLDTFGLAPPPLNSKYESIGDTLGPPPLNREYESVGDTLGPPRHKSEYESVVDIQSPSKTRLT